MTTAMAEQSKAVEVVFQSFDEMQNSVNQVNQAMGEQTGTAEQVPRSWSRLTRLPVRRRCRYRK